ncbi:site-specific integrase [Thalassospira profundimaris]|nr:site-specific integrase [Thalassospira profundimaris]
MADTRYLLKRRQGWYFRMKIPADLRPHYGGKSQILKSLRTGDLSKAQSLRWQMVADQKAEFEVLTGVRDWTPAQIEEKAEREFTEFLVQLNEDGVEEEELDITRDVYVEKLRGREPLSDLDFAMTRARIYACSAREAALNGKVYPKPTSFGRNTIDPVELVPYRELKQKKKKEGPLFRDVAKRYLEQTQRHPSSRLTQQTIAQYQVVHRLFDEWAGRPTLEEVTRQQAAEFIEVVSTLDPYWGRSPKTKQRSFSEIMERFGNHEVGLSNRTLNRYSTGLSLVWKWAGKQGLFEGKNPWKWLQRPEGQSRKTGKLPFTQEEVCTLLSQKPEVFPSEQDYPNTLLWVCWIAAFSGMRLNEICERKVSDLKQQDGIWCLEVTGAKTEAGDRLVPLHSTLLDLGLLEFARHHRQEYLFPCLLPGGPDKKRSWYLTRRFVEYRRSLGVTRIDSATQKDRVNFHSFRRTVIQQFEHARLPQTEVAQVVGHERVGITYGTYNPDGLDLTVLKEIIEVIEYPNLVVHLEDLVEASV